MADHCPFNISGVIIGGTLPEHIYHQKLITEGNLFSCLVRNWLYLKQKWLFDSTSIFQFIFTEFLFISVVSILMRNDLQHRDLIQKDFSLFGRIRKCWYSNGTWQILIADCFLCNNPVPVWFEDIVKQIFILFIINLNFWDYTA